MGALFSTNIPQDREKVKQYINELIAFKKIVVISKSWCLYCKWAQKIFDRYPLKEGSVEWVQVNKRDDGKEIQDYIGELTGARTVPRIFIGGEFFGGYDDLNKARKDGVLQQKLKAIGAM